MSVGGALRRAKSKKFNFNPVPLDTVYPTVDEYQIHGNIPIDKRRPPISEDLKESIKYMRRRVELKHRNLELDKIE